MSLKEIISLNQIFRTNYYPPFNWDNYDETTCQNEMRFEKADILRLKHCLQIPDEVKFYKGSYLMLNHIYDNFSYFSNGMLHF